MREPRIIINNGENEVDPAILIFSSRIHNPKLKIYRRLAIYTNVFIGWNKLDD